MTGEPKMITVEASREPISGADDTAYSRRGQSGASLVLVLVLVVITGVVLMAVGAFAGASARSAAMFRSVQDLRYAGDGAINATINLVRKDGSLAVDPNYVATDCVHSVATKVGDVTVSCEPPDDATGSGVPPHQGIKPPEALLLLGTRQTEPGQYNQQGCSPLGKQIDNWWSGYGGASSDDAENGLTMRKISMIRPADITQPETWLPLCNGNRVRGNGPVLVKGGVVVAGRAASYKDSSGSGIKMKIVGAPGTLKQRFGCSEVGGSFSAWADAGCTSLSASETRPAGSVSAGSVVRMDPGRVSSVPGSSDAATLRNNTLPFNDIQDAFLPIGFKADGTLRDNYDLPVRTTAYKFNPAANTSGTTAANGTVDVPKYLEPVANCTSIGAGQPIIFLPGWYKSSEVLSRYTANNACPDRTFWFAPNAGPDLELLTADDVTGAFYMEFRSKDSGGTAITGRACGVMSSALYSRWCLGGSGLSGSNSNSKPRVVVGTPAGWTPFPESTVTLPGGGTPPAAGQVDIELNTAKTSTKFLSLWTNVGGAASIGGSTALFEPCFLFCWSLGDRALMMNDFMPKTTAGPVAEGPVAGDPVSALKGRVYIDFNYQLYLGTYPSYYQPALEIAALDDQGVEKTCLAIDLSKDPAYSSALKLWTTPPDKAREIADNCGSVAMVNNLQVYFKLKSTSFWAPFNPGYPKVKIDGSRIRFKSYTGASFPVGTDGSYASDEPAKSDCDDTKPGAQLIFAAESHVYVADGSLEVCGGPDPDSPATRMVTGIYGVPAVESLAPINLTSAGGSGNYLYNSIASDAWKKMRIGEPGGREWVDIGIQGAVGATREARVEATFPALSNVPTGYKVGKIEARVSYNSNNPSAAFDLGSEARLWPSDNSSCKRSMPLTKSMAQSAHIAVRDPGKSSYNLVLFDSSEASNCLGVSQSTVNPLASQLKLTYAARASQACVGNILLVPTGWSCWDDDYWYVGGVWKDQLEGIELDVTLVPQDTTNSAAPLLVPESGCIVAHPNYFAGQGKPDCAVVKADSFRESADAPREDTGTGLRGNWLGRVSVKGAIYTPAAAIEYDDSDIAYPLASRGIIARHLLITGAKKRANFNDPMIGGDLNQIPPFRSAIFTACIKGVEDGTKCGEAGDRILTQAAVRFEPINTGTADAPVVVWKTIPRWWSDRVAG